MSRELSIRDSAAEPATTIDLRDTIDLREPARVVDHSIVIPAYDEQDRLPLAMDALADRIDPRRTEIIVVDDGSTDRTAQVADDLLSSWPHGRRISLDRNRGKGGAVRAGILASTGDRVAFLDADSATDASCLHDLFSALDTADVAIGSRAMSDSVIEQYHQDRALMGRAFNVLVRSATGIPWRDTQCGFKAFRTPVAKLLFALGNVDGFAFDVEVLDLAHRLGLRTVEVPVRWHHVEGSKVRHLRDSVGMTYDVVRASRSEHHKPVQCLNVALTNDGAAVAAVLDQIPRDVLYSWDRGTLELVIPPGQPVVGAVTVEHLRQRGIDVEPVVRSGNEVIERCRWGALSIGAPMARTPAPPPRSRATPAQFGRDTALRLLQRSMSTMGRRPVALPIVRRSTPMGSTQRIDGHTQLVVEGFPRSGKTFVATALRHATHNGIALVSNVQHPAQVKVAVRRRIPTLLLVRRPIPALASYLTAGPHARPKRVLREYIAYHQELLPFLDDIAIVDFDDAVADLQPVFDRLNERFDLAIPEFEHSERSVSRIFTTIGERHLAVHSDPDPEPTVPRPSQWRRELNEKNAATLQHPVLAPLLDEAEHLHRLFLASRR